MMPSGEMQRNGSQQVMEDCRDFLRTGRCKYGASCKYNHPDNVQVGGGMRAPVNPSEPLYPIRPDQPLCQYFLKHGNCKFGQACKFHHPPQALATSNGHMYAQPVRKVDSSPQLVMNTVSTDANGQPMVVQFLPQRPEEADCIYFLKNGKCKYGSTCRFHHPIGERKLSTKPRSGSFGQPVEYIAHPVPQSSVQRQQVMISDTLHPVGVGPDGPYSLRGGTARTEVGSSASSLASSFDTASSNMDFVQSDIPGLWTRARKNGSGGSLNAYTAPSRPMRPSASDGNMMSHRAGSQGNGNDQGVYFDSYPANPASWREYVRHDGSPVSFRGTALPPQPRRATPRRGNNRGQDEGFAMMTSSLLTMLDTTEEAASGESVSDDEVRYQQQRRYIPQDQIDQLMFQQMSLNDTVRYQQQTGYANSYRDDSWSPPWRSMNRQHDQQSPDQNNFQRQGSDPNGDGSDVGLYLP